MDPVSALMDWEDDLPSFELPLFVQVLMAGGVAALLAPPLIAAGVVLNAWRRWRQN